MATAEKAATVAAGMRVAGVEVREAAGVAKAAGEAGMAAKEAEMAAVEGAAAMAARCSGSPASTCAATRRILRAQRPQGGTYGPTPGLAWRTRGVLLVSSGAQC